MPDKAIAQFATAMSTPEFYREVRDTCRQVVRERVYSPALVAKLIDWLYHPLTPIRCDARVALQYLGAPAFHDLFACINNSSRPVEPDAICVLASVPDHYDEILSRLRTWAQDSTGDVQSQATLCLAGVWRDKMKAGETPNPQDVELCRTNLRNRLTTIGGIARHHWKWFIRDFGEGNA